jgi:feruloyl esterase
MVQNNTEINNFTVASEEEFEHLVQVAKETNPGGIIASNPNISEFLSHGKLLTFHGFADVNIPSRSSIQCVPSFLFSFFPFPFPSSFYILCPLRPSAGLPPIKSTDHALAHRYYEGVSRALGFKDLSSSYRLFMAPGMGHCFAGPGAWKCVFSLPPIPSLLILLVLLSFGSNTQSALSSGGGGQSSVFDAQHDMVLALIDWVENGNAPDVIIAAKYINDDKNEGVKFERKLCPCVFPLFLISSTITDASCRSSYPQQGVYIGGNTTSHESFECRYA